MASVTYQRELPVYRTVDVLVMGAGSAGICAATMGLVGPFMTSFDAKNEKMVIRGMFKEVVDRMIALGGARSIPKTSRAGTPNPVFTGSGMPTWALLTTSASKGSAPA